MKSTPYFLFSNYTLSVIPLFILMGAFAERSGLSQDLFRAASALVGHRRGGMAMAVIGACTAFGAICGSSVATTATFGRAALPELSRYRYAPGLATGTIAVGGTLGILIPPSVILVVYAISTEQNIVKLFQAALIPGLMATLFYCVGDRLDRAPQPGSRAAACRRSPLPSGCALLVGIWPALIVALIVVGGIYGGVFTPTEGAAVGAIAMLLIGVARRSLCWQGFQTSLDPDRGDHGADLHHPARRRGLQRIPRLLAAADRGRGNDRRDGHAALCGARRRCSPSTSCSAR